MAGIFVLAGLMCLAYMTVRLGNISVLGGDFYSITARFNSVSGLRVGNPVEMLGLEIGHVSEFKMDQDNQVAVAALQIKNGIEIYDDAIASIKTAGLIGDRYISIDAGGGGERLGPGDMITETESPVDIGDLISKYAFGDVKE